MERMNQGYQYIGVLDTGIYTVTAVPYGYST